MQLCSHTIWLKLRNNKTFICSLIYKYQKIIHSGIGYILVVLGLWVSETAVEAVSDLPIFCISASVTRKFVRTCFDNIYKFTSFTKWLPMAMSSTYPFEADSKPNLVVECCKIASLLLSQNEQEPCLLLNSRLHSYVEVKKIM